MASKKHYSPRYHKHRDLSRLSTSAVGSSRKRFRHMKAYKHRAQRVRLHAHLVSLTKVRCRCANENSVACLRCDGLSMQPPVNRRFGHGLHDNLKYVRWEHDKLNPGYRWANAVRARFGNDALASRLRALPGNAGGHLMFHIRLGEPSVATPVCSVAQFKRVLDHHDLTFGTTTKHLLHELARFAYAIKAEHRLSMWSRVYTGQTLLANGRLWLPLEWNWHDLYHPTSGTSIHVPLRKDTRVGYQLNDKWEICHDRPGAYDRLSGAHRPLHDLADIGQWSADMSRFFDTFYVCNYLYTPYGRWVYRRTLSFLQQKGNQ
jgi:hypothetical protein